MFLGRQVAILTSGGDAPGMNCCIRGFFYRAVSLGLKVWGVPDGYRGLCEENFFELTRDVCDRYVKTGGTFLGTARYEAFLDKAVEKACADKLKNLGIDTVVGIGGDGTYRGLMCLSELGIRTIALPGSVDNDVPHTDFSIGFHSALSNIVDSLDRIRDTMESHHRLFIVQTMGRHCPALAETAGFAAGADIVLSQAEPPDFRKTEEKVQKILASGKRSVLIVTSENLIDAADWAARLGRDLGIETRADVLGHTQRGGTPAPIDRILATAMGIKAAELCAGPDKGSIAVGTRSGVIVETPLKADNRCIAPDPLTELVLEAERKAR